MFNRLYLKYFFCLVLGIFYVQGASLEEAKAFIDSLGRKAINTLTNSQDSSGKIQQNFSDLLDEAFDVPKISEFVLGRIGNQASETQKAQFLKIFKMRLERAYAMRFKEFKGVTFKIKDGRVEKDGGVIINSTLQKPGGPLSSVDWKVYRSKAGPLKIYDVTVEGVSMALTLRSDYGAAFGKSGSNVEKFLKDLA